MLREKFELALVFQFGIFLVLEGHMCQGGEHSQGVFEGKIAFESPLPDRGEQRGAAGPKHYLFLLVVALLLDVVDHNKVGHPSPSSKMFDYLREESQLAGP